MDAYDVLDCPIQSIDEKFFNNLIIEFRKSYFIKVDYNQRISKHRKPIEFLQELLDGNSENRGLNQYLIDIQIRPEMRDIHNNCNGHVPSKIIEIWNNDKNLKSLYNSVVEYCKLREKDINMIAVHIAEYRALNKVFYRIRKIIDNLIVSANEKKEPINKKNDYYKYHIDEMEAIRKQFEIASILTQEDFKRLNYVNLNSEEEIISRIVPLPKNHKESYKLFIDYYGKTMFSIYKNAFFQKYGSWIEPNIRAEIAQIEQFIKNAEEKDYNNAVGKNNLNDNYEYCYLRLKNNYYLYNDFSGNDLVFNSALSSVYGKYFLFYEYLQQLLPHKLPTQGIKQSVSINSPVIALFCKVLNDCKIVLQEETEADYKYCERICNQFNLKYTDNVRQQYRKSDNKRNREKLKEQILPTLDEKYQKDLLQYLS